MSVALPLTATTAPAHAAEEDDVLSVLLFYKDNFHASHVQARQAVNELAADLASEHGQTLQVEETQDAGAFNADNLATKDAVVFAQTGGVLFNTEQRAALEDYIRGGGGYMGLHYAGWSVGQSEHDVNPFYLRLVGAMSEGHPENPAIRSGKVVVNDATHPLAAGLPSDFTRSDEWYDWTVNPAQDVRTILSVDESSYNSAGQQGTNHPVTWCQQIDSGRSWYTAMGHEGTAYSEPVMRTQMRNGLAYASGLVAADCSPPAKDQHGRWSGVTPWPLMPINMTLTADGKVQSFGSVSSGCTDSTPFDFSGNSCVFQGGQTEFDVWDPAVERTLENYRDGLSPNTTYTDLFCSMQVQNPHRKVVMTVGGDDSLGGNAPNDAAIGVTSFSSKQGLRDEAPMNIPRWYPTGTTMPDGSIVVQGGSLRGGPGGPGVLTPEVYRPDEGNGWTLLTGATSAAAYGDGGGGQPDENRWWYPRAFVAPGSGTLFNISGTQMFELDPSGDGELTLRGTLPANVADQGANGRPVGATSTAAMYRPGKILQVGGGWWANGGGPAGARAGFTVDITGGTENPVVEPTSPMKYQRHWATATVLPDGDVLVTGGSRDNADNGGYVTTAEVWDPDTDTWTAIEAPYAHARLYHSSALLLPDGRVMIGGGGAPGPRNYTDVEYYSPAYLFDGDELAERPEITAGPKKIGYDGTFDVSVSGGPVSRVTLVRNGSVTHGFNNDQNFQDLEFTQSGGTLTVTAPQDATYAPPGAYMLFVHDADGTPSVAKIMDVDPAVKLDQRAPKVVDQFEYPKLPAEWRSANPPMVIDLEPGNGRMAPWSINEPVQLVRGASANQGGLGLTGYQFSLGNAGEVERTLAGLDPGREYRISMRYARDSRSAGTEPAVGSVQVGDLDTTITAGTDTPSASGNAVTYRTWVDTFTATARSEVLTLSGSGSGGGLMLDDLVVISTDPGVDEAPVHYEFSEGSGTTAENTGTDTSVGDAVLTGDAGWTDDGVFGKGLELPGGDNANAVDLPDDLLQGEDAFSTSFWVRPDTKANWIGLLHIGDGLGDAGSFFQVQMQTDAAPGGSGLAATFKAKGSSDQERVYAVPTKDVAAGRWNHVVFTRDGATGTLYLDGVQVAQRTDLTIDMTDIGPTSNNWLGRNGYPDPAYDGRMDDVRLYTSALSDDDVAALYDEGAALRTTTSVSVDLPSPSPWGEPLTVSAEVEDESGGDAEGSAELWVDGSRVGQPVAVSGGEVSFPALTLPPGERELEVRFQAADGWRDSRDSVTHTVDRPPVGEGTPVHYTFDEGSGSTAANSGTNPLVGDAQLQGAVGWTQDGKYGKGLSFPGGGSATGNHLALPDDIAEGMDEQFSVSLWVRPGTLPQWVPLVQIGSSTDTFFLLQSNTQTNGPTGFAATFKAPGTPGSAQERLVLGPGNDVPLNEWTHVVFTMSGSTGKLYFDGELVGTRTDFTIGIGDVGVDGHTTANMLGGTSWPDGRWNGLMDDFRLFGYELTAEEVTQLNEHPFPNAAPEAAADEYSVVEGTTLTVDAPGVLANDTDADDDPLTATGATQPEHGEVTLAADGSFTYTPEDGFTGTDTFTYEASDGTAESEPARVTITVEEADDPVATTVKAKAVTVVYGKKASLAVTVSPAAATGKVEARSGSTLLVSRALSSGKATLVLPARSLKPGTRTVTLRYLGDATHAASSSTVKVVVRKAAAKLRVAAPASVKRNARPSVTVTVVRPSGVPVSGVVRVSFNGKVVSKKVNKAGKVTIRLGKATRLGRIPVRVTYRGSAYLKAATKVAHIRVRR